MSSLFKINCKKTDTDGFTLIELIAVLVLSGILLTVIISRMSAVSDYELAAQADKLKAQLRYAQILAMNTDSVWGIEFKGSSYHLFKDGNIDNKVILLGEDTIDVNLPDGITLTQIVSFDGWGRPSETAEAASPSTENISLAFKAITISRNTGYIP